MRTFGSKSFDPIRHKPLVQTTAEDLLSIVHNNGHSVAHYLRRLHNLACDLGWLAWPILAKRVWPKIRSRRRRAVTTAEHAKIIASEKNPEKHAYYEFLYETGAAQSDAAELTAENVHWQDGLLVYYRKKLGPNSEPARLSIGAKLRELLESLPRSGDLFPTIKRAKPNARSTEFRRRCRIAGVSGVSLHSYRHSWAQRAKASGYPQRFAQDALGHSSRAVHEAYAKGAALQTKEGVCVPAEFRQWCHGYVVTSHKAQGWTADHVVVAAERLTAKGAYVACSRGRKSCIIHTPDKERLVERLPEGNRCAALDVLSEISTTNAPTLNRVSAWKQLAAYLASQIARRLNQSLADGVHAQPRQRHSTGLKPQTPDAVSSRPTGDHALKADRNNHPLHDHRGGDRDLRKFKVFAACFTIFAVRLIVGATIRVLVNWVLRLRI